MNEEISTLSPHISIFLWLCEQEYKIIALH